MTCPKSTQHNAWVPKVGDTIPQAAVQSYRGAVRKNKAAGWQ